MPLAYTLVVRSYIDKAVCHCFTLLLFANAGVFDAKYFYKWPYFSFTILANLEILYFPTIMYLGSSIMGSLLDAFPCSIVKAAT